MDDPLPGHEQYYGWLAIPYLRPEACASIRFRCIQDHDHSGHGKYMTVSGDQPWIYNTNALGGDEVGICEGEIDAIAATACGFPSVGIPGVEAWQDSWARLFDGYRRVLVFADGDAPGKKFARKLASQIDTAKVIQLGDEMDVNDYVLEYGAQGFRERTV